MKAVKAMSLDEMIDETTEARFMENVRRAGPGECWEWTGARLPSGYPRFKPSKKAPYVYAHRVAYELFRGPIPYGFVVCHECDNPPCVNPAHLKAASQSENIYDAMQRKRYTQFKDADGMREMREATVARGGRRYVRAQVEQDGIRVSVCKRGHVVAGDNALTQKDGYVKCKTCLRLVHQRARDKRRQLRVA